jgi:hypothetical protein
MADSDLEKAVNEISKDIEILESLKEKIDSVCPNSKGNSKDADFQKVQILANHYESWFAFLSAIAAGGLILLITASLTVYWTFGILYGYISFGLTAVGGLYIIGYMRKGHRKQLEKINELMNRIEKEESLPSIIELEHNS